MVVSPPLSPVYYRYSLMKTIRTLLVGLGFIIGGIVLIVLFGIFLLLVRDTFSHSAFNTTNYTPPVAPLPPPTVIAPTSVATAATVTTAPAITPPPTTPARIDTPSTETYITIKEGCGPHFEGECLNARSGPGTEYPSVSKLRTGMVLKVGDTVHTTSGTWYKIVFNEWLRYPERLTSDWYVSADYVDVVYDQGEIHHDGIATSTKRIVVDRSEQKLSAYDGDAVFMETSISTGLELSPTPRGTFTIFKKTPSRYMQGPLPYLTVSKYYDLPGVPWNMYFTELGAVIHGAYWHNNFGSRYSSGCVNLPPDEARRLYEWAELGTTITIHD